MLVQVKIETESDPAFIVQVFAAKFSRMLNNPVKRSLMAGINGIFALAFSDGQALTITAQRKENKTRTIHLGRGVSKSAGLVIHIDSKRPEKKPRIEGLFKHPLLALKVGKVLDDSQSDLKMEASTFWEFASPDSGFPGRLTVSITDQNETLHFGTDDTDEMVIEGNTKTLHDLFSGSSILIQEAFTGKVKINGTTQQIAEFSRLNIAYMTHFDIGNPDDSR